MAGARPPRRGLRAASLACLLLLASSAAPGRHGEGPLRLREHLWATGHFMGKKSTLGPSSHWGPPTLKRAEPDHVPEAWNPVATAAVEELKELLRRELLATLLQWSLAEEEQAGRKEPQEQDFSSLRKLLAKYI